MSERVRGNKFLTGKQLDKMEEGEEFFVQITKEDGSDLKRHRCARATSLQALYGVSDGIQTNLSARSIKEELTDDNAFDYIDRIKPKLSREVYEKCCAFDTEKRKLLCEKLDQEVEIFDIEREIERKKQLILKLDTAINMFYRDKQPVQTKGPSS